MVVVPPRAATATPSFTSIDVAFFSAREPAHLLRGAKSRIEKEIEGTAKPVAATAKYQPGLRGTRRNT